MGCCNGNDDRVRGDFTRDFEDKCKCKKCFRKCEDALEFIEDIKDLLDEFFDDDKHHDCCKKCCCDKCCCKNDNYWGR